MNTQPRNNRPGPKTISIEKALKPKKRVYRPVDQTKPAIQKDRMIAGVTKTQPEETNNTKTKIKEVMIAPVEQIRNSCVR